MNKFAFRPVFYIFLGFSLALLILYYLYPASRGISGALLSGNLVLLAAALVSFRFYRKAIEAGNIQAFMRMVYMAMISKMLICMAAVMIYAFMVKPISKTAILGFFGLYFIYTFVEVRIAMRLNKEKKKNA
jgi:hypothetical protein